VDIRIGVIVSTTRPTRVGKYVAEWFIAEAPKRDGVSFELIDLKDVNLPLLSEPKSASSGEYEQASSKAWSDKIKGYDGFVIATAEYNNGIPAPLKNAIDTLYHEWNRKPVAFVGYGTYAAARAIEQLVNVTAKVGMVPLPKIVVGIVNPWEAVADDGQVNKDFVVGNMEGMVDNLVWWARTVKSAQNT